MLLPAVYLSLLIVAFARTGSAAAIDSDLRNRDVPFKRAAPGWVNGAINNFQGAVHNLPGFVAGTVGGAIDSAENHATALIPGGLIASAQNCPKIIEKTNWDKYLGVAPIATAINKPCPWVVRSSVSSLLCVVVVSMLRKANAHMLTTTSQSRIQ